MTRSVWPTTVGAGAVGVGPGLITTGPLLGGGAITTGAPVSRSTSLVSLLCHTQPLSVAMSSGVVSAIVVTVFASLLIISLCPSQFFFGEQICPSTGSESASSVPRNRSQAETGEDSRLRGLSVRLQLGRATSGVGTSRTFLPGALLSSGARGGFALPSALPSDTRRPQCSRSG